MTKINLENAYDDFTQETLFMNELEESVESGADYSDAPGIPIVLTNSDPDKITIALTSFTEFTRAVLNLYKTANEKEISKIKQPLSYYVNIDYSAMLRDDLINGYVTVLKTANGTYRIYLAPEGFGKANIADKN